MPVAAILYSLTALPLQIAISGPKAGERVPDFGSLIGSMLIQQLAGRGVEAGGEGGATRDVRNRCAATRIRTGCMALRLQGRAGRGRAGRCFGWPAFWGRDAESAGWAALLPHCAFCKCAVDWLASPARCAGSHPPTVVCIHSLFHTHPLSPPQADTPPPRSLPTNQFLQMLSGMLGQNVSKGNIRRQAVLTLWAAACLPACLPACAGWRCHSLLGSGC